MKQTIIFSLIISVLSFQVLRAETLEEFKAKRESMIERKVQEKGITDKKIIEALKTTPLEDFHKDFHYIPLTNEKALLRQGKAK